MTAIYALASLGSLVCFIMVLIQLFKAKGAGHGILGILSCGIYPFIWGWMNAKKLALNQIMLIWSVCMGLSMVTGMFASAAMAPQIMKQIEEQQKQAAPGH